MTALALRLVGGALLALGLAHPVLPVLLGWRAEFARLSPLTRRIMYLHTYFIGLACVLGGLPLLAAPDALLAGGTGAVGLLAAETVFWTARWACQVAFPPSIWRARRLYTVGHGGFLALWSAIVAVLAVGLVTATTS